MDNYFEKKLASGAILRITLASFPEGNQLFKAVSREIEELDFNQDTVHKFAFRIISSETVEKCLWVCMARATYNNFRLTSELFEDATIRGDYIEVAKEVLVYNLTPFFKGLDSALSVLNQLSTNNLK